LHDLLKSNQWVKSEKISAALKSPLMRLCARYATALFNYFCFMCTSEKGTIVHYLSRGGTSFVDRKRL
jgi:hypothetical protein